MSRKFLTPVVLATDPTAPLEAATKQYVDNSANFTFVQAAMPTATKVGQTWWSADDTTLIGISSIAIDRGGGVLVWVQFA